MKDCPSEVVVDVVVVFCDGGVLEVFITEGLSVDEFGNDARQSW